MPHTPKMTPFYQSALDAFTTTQKQQIEKGAQKYPEPFNPLSWSPDALLQHAMEEAVDLVHYLTGLHQQIQAREQEIRRLNDIIQDKDRNISLLIESQKNIVVRTDRKLSPFEELEIASRRQMVLDASPRDPLQPWNSYKAPKPPYMDLDD